MMKRFWIVWAVIEKQNARTDALWLLCFQMGNIAKGIVYGGGIIAFGYALMKWTVPTEQEMREVNKERALIPLLLTFIASDSLLN